jgi:hypothetical protein
VEVSGQIHTPAALPLKETTTGAHRRLGELQCRLKESSAGHLTPAVQTVARPYTECTVILEYVMERSRSENTEVVGRTKLKLILEELDGRVLIGFVWLKIGIIDGLL